MAKVREGKPSDRKTLELSGSLTVARGRKVREAVLKGLRSAGGLELSLGKVDEVDLSFLQILTAAWKTAREENKEFSVRAPVPEALVEAALLSGMDNHGQCRGAGCPLCAITRHSAGD